MLIELVYNSVAVPKAFPEVELQKILAGARKHNAELGITGVLLYHGGEFVQLLEGPRAAVEHVYRDVILRDRRHAAVNLDWEQEITRRGFAEWSMGFARGDAHAGDPGAAPVLAGHLPGGIAGLDLSGPGSAGRTLLLSIYASMRGA